MPQYRTIEIDFEVHKRIEAERRSFSDTPNDVLRRKFGLGPGRERRRAESPPNEGSWSGKGVTLEAGTLLRIGYGGKISNGEIDDGTWLVEGQRYGTPSAAAIGVARTKAGRKTNLNGWRLWQVKRPGDENWIPLQSLRPGWGGANTLTLKDLGLE
jgi:hypothetical protein